MTKKKSRFLQGLFLILILMPLAFLGCSDEGEQNEVDAKWQDRENAFLSGLKKQEMRAIDFGGSESFSPVAKTEETDENILKEPLREWVLGVMGAESGELSDYGKKTLNGFTLAVNDINENGGIKGRMVKYLRHDTYGSIGGALDAADAMIAHNVMAIIGSPTSEVTFSATKVLNDNRTILFSAGTRRRLGDTGIYHFRNTLPDDTAISELVRYCIQEKGFNNFGLFSSMVNDFSVEMSAFFKSAIMLQGANISKELFLWPKTSTYVTKKQSSIKLQIETLKEGKPVDALIFTGNFEEGLEVLKAMEEAGMTIPLIGGEDLADDRFLTEAGKLGARMIVFSGFNRNDPEPLVKKFVADYKKEYGEMPDRVAALAYDAVKTVLKAAENAHSLRSGFLRREILGIKDFKGVTGVTSFTESGEAIKNPVIFEVKEEGEGLKFLAVTGYR